jgi:hypothetical protein
MASFLVALLDGPLSPRSAIVFILEHSYCMFIEQWFLWRIMMPENYAHKRAL